MHNMRRIMPVVGIVGLIHLLFTAALLAPIGQLWPTAPRSLDLSIQTVPPDLTALIAQSDRIVRGHVTEVRSFWNERHTQIDSENVIEVRYALGGEMVTPLRIRTEGGYLADEGLGMKSTNTPSFVTGEEVLLFLKANGATYEIVENEAGKYAVRDGLAVNPVLREQVPLADLLTAITNQLTVQGRSASLPTDWQERELAVAPASLDRTEDFVYEDLRWAGADPVVRLKININTDQAGGSDGSVQNFTDAIIAAAATWSLVPGAALGLIYDGTTTATDASYNGVNEVMFFTLNNSNVAGRTRIWFNANRTILEADFWFNDAMQWDTTGNPVSSELDLESAALHEFGHWLGLGHDSEAGAVMYASLTTGTTKRALHPNDIAGISFIYPCPDEPCIPPEYATPTVVPTSTPTLTPTFTPTPRATATPVPPRTVAPTATPSPRPSATPTRGSTPGATLTATVSVTATLIATIQPTTPPGPTPAARIYLPLVDR